MTPLAALKHAAWWLTSPTYRHTLQLDKLTPEPQSVTLVGGQRIYNVHPVTACLGVPCCVHNPSNHHMASWRQHWRGDRKLMERICEHGIGHPDPDHLAYLRRTFHATSAVHQDAVHGCDQCCHPERDWMWSHD